MPRRSERLEKEVGEFMHDYSRKSRRGFANDRRYSREVETLVKRMPPEELDALLRGQPSDEEAAPSGGEPASESAGGRQHEAPPG
jgi:hypothetical protein